MLKAIISAFPANQGHAGFRPFQAFLPLPDTKTGRNIGPERRTDKTALHL
jgi:hypothetical protein